MATKIYFVEGNIGCGKTTLLDAIEKYIRDNNIQNMTVVYEPVRIWQELGLLDKFYKDICRWSYTFQNVAFITKMMELQKMTDDDMIYIVERSPMTDRNCFAQLCYEDGYMTEMEWNVYNMWYSHYSKDLSYNGFIYLNTQPDVCYNRINVRNRGEESGIGLNYLEKLHNKHIQWLSAENDGMVLYLEDNYNLDTIQNAVEIILAFLANGANGTKRLTQKSY